MCELWSDDLIYDFTAVFCNIVARIYCSLLVLHRKLAAQARNNDPNAIGRREVH